MVSAVVLHLTFKPKHLQALLNSFSNSQLSATQLFKLFKLALVLAFAISCLFLFLVFLSPAIYQAFTPVESPPRDFDTALANAHRLFSEEKDYQSALAEFRRVFPYAITEETKNSIIGYTTASYYATGQHIEGLQYICNLYKEHPSDDYRYRYDIHAHIRKLALSQGNIYAESHAIKLRKQCKRLDFSPVWSAIPLAKMEYLKKGFTTYDEQYHLYDRDSSNLRRIIEVYSDDPFIDHAYYFLGHFGAVYTRYPKSYIADVALFADAQRHRRHEGGKRYQLLLDRYPNSRLRGRAIHRVIEAHLHEGDFAAAKSVAIKYNANISRSGLEYGTVRRMVGRYGLTQTVDFLLEDKLRVDVFDFSFLGQTLVANLSVDELLMNLNRIGIPLEDFAAYPFYRSVDTGGRYIDRGEYKKALSEYNSHLAVLNAKEFKKYAETYISDYIHAQTNHLSNIIKLLEDQSAAGLFRLAIALRNSRRQSQYERAVQLFRSILTIYPESPQAEKALYLAASTYRRMNLYMASADIIQEYLPRYADGELADDLIAEIGVYHLLIRRDPKRAREYWKQVLEDYGSRNAADNALNWIAWSYLWEDDYVNALKYFSELAINYSGSRLARAASMTREKLASVVSSQVTSKSIKGVEFKNAKLGNAIVVVGINYIMYISEIRRGDRVHRVENQEVKNMDEFGRLLNKYESGEKVGLVLKRGRDIIIRVYGFVQEGGYFRKSYESDDRYLKWLPFIADG